MLERGEIDAGALQRGVARFRGVARRLDKKTTTSRVPVYEGFGSSYEKARSAIEAIFLHFPGRPAVVVFEPHTFSWRNQAALGWYDTVFKVFLASCSCRRRPTALTINSPRPTFFGASKARASE